MVGVQFEKEQEATNIAGPSGPKKPREQKPQRFSPFPVVFIREHGLLDNRAIDGNVS